MIENHEVFAETVIGEFLGQYWVDRVSTVEGGVRRLELHRYRVVLLDYDLDDGKGTEVLRRMGSLGLMTPVVAISARPEGNEALSAAGAAAVCHKMDFADIASVIATVCAS